MIIRAKSPLVVLGARFPARLELSGRCIVVFVDGVPSTAVFPPDATLIIEQGKPSAVVYPGRRLPIGVEINLPGGGSASSSDLANPLPQGSPSKLYPVGG